MKSDGSKYDKTDGWMHSGKGLNSDLDNPAKVIAFLTLSLYSDQCVL